ncbi:MAG: calcium-binding protein [Treponema sp.]|jgi:hypothetical protein|nr:calcium-binding protein [Treponema sp.]
MAREGHGKITAETEQDREERIINEIVVDAYDETERAMSWFAYLEDTLNFPFKAKCLREMAESPLRKHETLMVRGMADSERCYGDMLVLVEWRNRSFGVPLEQLLPVEEEGATARAVKDWHYWKARGYTF